MNNQIEELKSHLDTMIGNSSQLKAEKLVKLGYRRQSELLIKDFKSNNGEVMSNKQIGEMAEVMCNLNTKEGCFCYGGYCNHNCLAYDMAERLYNAGYRKQSEWISVDERLPEKYGDYLVAVKTKKLWETEWEHGVSVACFVISEIPNVNGWNIEIEDGYQYEITHWMPLPVPPKMKGGAE